MSTLVVSVVHWLGLTGLLARCSLLRLRHRHRLRAYEVLPVSEGLHLASAEQLLARSLLALWRHVALTDSNGVVMGFVMLMGRVQILVVGGVCWLTGEAPLSLLSGARLHCHPERSRSSLLLNQVLCQVPCTRCPSLDHHHYRMRDFSWMENSYLAIQEVARGTTGGNDIR